MGCTDLVLDFVDLKLNELLKSVSEGQLERRVLLGVRAEEDEVLRCLVVELFNE